MSTETQKVDVLADRERFADDYCTNVYEPWKEADRAFVSEMLAQERAQRAALVRVGGAA